MVAVHDSDGELGTIYLDLLPRSAPLPCCVYPLRRGIDLDPKAKIRVSAGCSRLWYQVGHRYQVGCAYTASIGRSCLEHQNKNI